MGAKSSQLKAFAGNSLEMAAMVLVETEARSPQLSSLSVKSFEAAAKASASEVAGSSHQTTTRVLPHPLASVAKAQLSLAAC